MTEEETKELTPVTYKCIVCGGIYTDPQANGRRYFHVCPDMTPVGARRGNILNAKVTLHGLERRPGKRIEPEPRGVRRNENTGGINDRSEA